jgi:hypothetical protein
MGFAGVVLGARDRDRRGELPDAREEGTLLHEALAAAFRATADLWGVRPRDAVRIEERALAAVDEVLSRELVGSPLRDVVLARARDDARAVLAWSLADDRWDFSRAEQSFGDGSDGAWPALRLETSCGALSLRGKIDRVDVGHLERRVRAIDYKRSKRKALEGAKDLGETAFQVPLYALVASRALGRPGMEGLYVPTGARDLRPDHRARDAFAAALAAALADDGGTTRAERSAATLVAEMRKGALAPLPRDKRACAHCEVRGGCRQPRFAVTPDEEEESP